MGFPLGSMASHTEIKAIERVHLASGETMIIRGTLPPCANCQGAMRVTSESGARVEYHYAVPDREEGEALIVDVWENGKKQ
jgi:Pput_2613-like deaminase